MSRDERMAFFINIYNALVVHAMALFGPAKSTIKRYAAQCFVPSSRALILG